MIVKIAGDRESEMKASLLIGASVAALAIFPIAGATAQDTEPLLDGEIPATDDQTIVVTGSRIQGDQFQAVTPVEVYSQADTDAAGFSTITDLVRDIPANVGSEANRSSFTQNNTLGTAQVNLRGLGLGATLVLLNGRRNVLSATFANDGSQFVDINQIPLSLIDRTEVVKTGASAIYGSDAVAGVVNFVTRQNFEGVELDGQFRTTTQDSQEDITLNALAGIKAGDVHLTFAGTYFDRSQLRFSDRDFTNRGTELEIATTKPGAFVLLAPSRNPAFAGTPVRVPIADPNCAAAGGTPITSPGGQFCQVSARDQFALVPDEKRLSLYSDARYQGPQGLDAFIEVLYSDSEASVSSRPAALPGAGASGTIVVAPDNPFNPFGAPVAFVGRPFSLEEASATDSSSSETFRLVAGVGYDVTGDVRVEGSYVHGQNEFGIVFNDLLTAGFFQPGTTTVRNDINLFGTALTDPALANDPALIDAATVEVPITLNSTLDVFELAVSGTAGEIAGNPIGFAIGAQYRQNSASFDVPATLETPGQLVFLFPQQDFAKETIGATSVFGELAIPIGERIDIQAAVRYESYSDGIGDTVDPKVAVTAEVVDDLVVRASYGTSFRAPTPLQIGGTTNQVGPIVNPCTGARVAAAFITNGNADLNPESASTYSAGLAYRQPGGLRFSVDYWRYDYDDVITRQSVEAVAANAQCVQAGPGARIPVAPGLTVNPATGQITSIEVDFVNAGSINTDGLDVALGYSFDAGRYGQFSTDLSATLVTKFDVAETRGGPTIDRLGSRNVTSFTRPTPELRGNLRLGYEKDAHLFTAIVRYTDSYRDDLNANVKIDSQTTLDLQYALRLDGMLGQGRSEFRIGAINVTDEDPPFVFDRSGYDPLVADPRGRTVYASITQSF